MAEIEPLFVSAGCNRTVRAAAWGACDLVAFAAHHSVAIFCPKTAAILLTLSGHKDRVNCVEWIPHIEGAEEFFLLSGSADGVVMLWALSACKKKWRNAGQIPISHGKSVTCISSVRLSSTEALFASSASDGVTSVWNVSMKNCSDVSPVDKIVTGTWSVVAVALAVLPGVESTNIALAMGSLDQHVHLYTGSKTGQFTLACKLKGHQDWIRGLDFSSAVHEDGAESLFLVSSSQDRNIRIWKLCPKQWGSSQQELSLKAYIEGPVFRAGKDLWRVSLESLLVGHEDWVFSVRWQPVKDGVQPLAVLSSSMDKAMMVWRPDAQTGIWMNEVTVGELSQTAFGFFGAVWSPSGDSILAHGFNGSFHLWENLGTGWVPQLVPSGHFGPVVDVAWARNGLYLLSASHDQTTRVFADWSKDGQNPESGWHEIARPQIHGHDMNCLAVVKGKGNHRYVSGADEKVARVFEAPGTFLDTLFHLTSSSDFDVRREDVKVLGANMSALGLSQKPIFTQGESNDTSAGAFDSMEYVPIAVPTVLLRPPLEEQLIQNTLWPESHKLYGHGNEVFAMCSSHAGNMLATACKAQTANVAEIWLWETESWRPVAQLRSHSLTVTQIEFSPDDRFLLSVSRDRHFSVFQLSAQGSQPSYGLVANVEAHKRIIWTCSWSPCSSKFATGSRDKIVKIWSLVEAEKVEIKLHGTLPIFKSSVTALAWGQLLLAVGMESGSIELWNVSGTWGAVCLKKFDAQICHAATVNRLCWKRAEFSEDLKSQQLASCGADHAVRLFNVSMS